MAIGDDSPDAGHDRDFRRDFSSIQRRVAVAGTAVFLLVAMTRVVRIGASGIDWLLWLLLAAIIGLVAIYIYSWRCPNCKTYLGITWNPRFCRECGVRLQ